MAAMTAALVGGAIVAGAAAGAMSKNSTSTNSSGVDAGSATAFETQGQDMYSDAATQLTGMVNAGPGQQDVTNAYNADTSLASMLGQYAAGGFQPTGTDVSTANSYANSLFGQQRQQLNQSFVDQTASANNQAAVMGRDANDPILEAKMRTAQNNQTAQLNAAQGSYAAQYAQQLPGMRLGYAGQQANVLGGLATQAMSNRQSLAAMGSGIMQNQQNYRLATATHYGTNNTSSGGGVGGAIAGGLAGMGAGMGAAGGFSSLMGGASSAMSAGIPAATMSNVQSGAFSNSLQMPTMGSQFGGSGYGFGVGSN